MSLCHPVVTNTDWVQANFGALGYAISAPGHQ